MRSFGTTTTALLELTDWLNGHGCTHVAMEATGVYWKPIWHNKDLGADHFSRHDRNKIVQRLMGRLNDLGCNVAMAQPA
jgi:hypothetical protein